MKYLLQIYRNKYAFVFLVFVLAIVSLTFFNNPSKISRAASDSLNGWAWSSNIGWVSFNCQDANVCSTSDYKVQFDSSNGKLSGYAWSSNIGWIQFDPSGPYPEDPKTSAVVDLKTGVVSGWLRALSYNHSYDDGWDGWIKITDAKVNNGKLEGWAWGGLVVGWLNFYDVNAPTLTGNFTLSLNGSAGCNFVPLKWTSSSNANGYRILKGSQRVDISPYQPYTDLTFIDNNVNQNTTYQYQIEAYNTNGTNRSNEIKITTPYCPPIVDLSVDHTSISQGQTITLTWTSSYANSCTASASPAQSDWTGTKPLNNTIGEVVKPESTSSITYTLSCSGPSGSASDSVTIGTTSLPKWKEVIPR